MKAEDLNLGLILRAPQEFSKGLSIKELEELIFLLKDYYYNTDTPLVPDSIYDQLEDVLRERSPKSKALAAIGAPVKDAVALPYPMPSLDKAKAGEGTVVKWMEKYSGPYVVSHKLDGISMMYHRTASGKVNLFTRGNGIKGQNVSGLLKYIDVGKIKIVGKDAKQELAIRGELIMSKGVWDKHYAADYPNVRNFISGLANAKHPDPTALRRVQLVAYQLMVPRLKPSEQMDQLEKWGFHVVSHQIEAKLDEARLSLKLERAREKGDYQIDGLVIAQNDVHSLTERNPKHAIAFKQTDEVAQTEVRDVIWKASKRFLLKPTVMIEPVFLSGGNLSKATGHNAKYIFENEIGPGAVVTIVRSGEVIPFIVSVDSPAPEGPDMPEVDFQWTDGGYDIEIQEETEEVAHAILVHMARTLEIKNLGPGVLAKVIDAGYTSPSEILNMTFEDWQEIPSLGKNAEKIYNSIMKLQTEGVWLSQLMDSSSIFGTGIGTKKLQLVLDEYPNLLELKDDGGLIAKLVKIKGIEKKTAEKIHDGLGTFINFMDQVPQIKIKDDDSEDSSESSEGVAALAGMRVVFTGVRNAELEQVIKRSGGTVASSVLKSHTNQVVVAKDPSAKSNKLKMAREHGFKIYSLQGFKDEFGLD